MAHRLKVPATNSDFGSFGYFFNLDAPVGLDSPNRPEDVALVQLLLRGYFEVNPSLAPPWSMSLIVNGFYSLTTLYWILHFQKQEQWLSRGLAGYDAMALDGKISPVIGPRLTFGAKGHKMLHALLWLNSFFAARHPGTFRDPSRNPVVPGLLANALTRLVG